MPIPLILGAAAAAAGLIGAGAGIHGGIKMKEAHDTIESAQRRHDRNKRRFKEKQEAATNAMDTLGELELNTLKSFKHFQALIEIIQNRPKFKPYEKNGVKIPPYDKEKIKEVSVGAEILLGGLGGAGLGTAGGLAASGLTTGAIMAFGTASTGTAISTLSGAAATNATLAALGGGSLAAGGGGMALGSLILGGATLGVGLLVGGIIFNITGSSLSDKADEAWSQMKKAEDEIDSICPYLDDLKSIAERYSAALIKVKNIYDSHIKLLYSIFNSQTAMYNTIDWNNFTLEQQVTVHNTSLLVGVLFNMCKVNIVNKSETEGEKPSINKSDIEQTLQDTETFLQAKKLIA